MRAARQQEGLRPGIVAMGLAEKNRVRIQKVVCVGQAGMAFGNIYRQTIAQLCGNPSYERLLFLFLKTVPQIGRQFIRSEFTAFTFGALLLFLNFNDADLPEMVCGFVV